jgi:hypothetical protein
MFFTVILKHPLLETEGGSLNPFTIETLYKERVTKQLQEIKTMLCQLFPLNFRWVRMFALVNAHKD